MDRKTQKIMMNRMYHPQNDTGRLLISRMEGGWGLLSIKDCVETQEQVRRSVGREIIEIF